MKKFLLKIKKSDSLSPTLQKISKMENCYFAFSVTSESIDGIVKVYLKEEKELEKLREYSQQTIIPLPIEELYKSDKKLEGNLDFFLEFYSKKSKVSELRDIGKKLCGVDEIYLVEKDRYKQPQIFLKGKVNSTKDVDELWLELLESGVVSEKGRKITYFALKDFSNQ